MDYEQMTAAQLVAELNDHLDWPPQLSPATEERIGQLRKFFDRLTEKFPLTGRYWTIYIEAEMKYGEFDKIENLFRRCLIKLGNIELWRRYLNYLKETKSSLPRFRENMVQAYEFALGKIGIDFLSFPIWNDYVQFLKGFLTNGAYATNLKITAIRRVYQRGIVNPMLNIENFWEDYIAYEQSIHPSIAERMVQDHSRNYMNAKRVVEEYKGLTEGLDRNFPSTWPYIRTEDPRQVELWKRYIQWESTNPLGSEDEGLVIRRVVLASEQFVLCVGYYPEVWAEFANYLEGNSRRLAENGGVRISKQLLEEAAAVCRTIYVPDEEVLSTRISEFSLTENPTDMENSTVEMNTGPEEEAMAS